MVIKMRRRNRGIYIICGPLNRAKFVNIMVTRNDHQSAGVLPRGTFNSRTAIYKAIDFRIMYRNIPFRKILFHKAVSRFICKRANRSSLEYMARSKKFLGIRMRCLLIFAGKIQVNIRFLVAFKPQKSLKRNVMPVFMQHCTADRTDLIRHITTTRLFHCIFFYSFRFKIRIFAIRTDIVRRQRIYLCNTCHICRERRTYRSSRTNQVAVRNRFPNQLLCNDIQYSISITDNRIQLRFQPFLHNFRQRISIDGIRFFHADFSKFFVRALNFGWESFVWDWLYLFNPVGNQVRICYNNLPGLFRPQIFKFPEHLVRCPQKQRRLLIAIRKPFRRHNDFSERRIRRINEMHIARCYNRLAIFFAQFHNFPVNVPNVLQRMDVFYLRRINHKLIISQWLYLQIIIEIYKLLNYRFRFSLQQRTVKLPCFACTAQN